MINKVIIILSAIIADIAQKIKGKRTEIRANPPANRGEDVARMISTCYNCMEENSPRQTRLGEMNEKEDICMSQLPKDPMILYSVLNMKLRDFYGSLDALCDDLDEDKQALLDAMAKAGFRYDPERNAFV